MLDDFSIILCEGDLNSIDYQIYSKVFDNKTVLPCGSNSILKVKEEKNRDNNVCAITDRDLLTSKEIEKLRKENIFTLKVRAIENMLVTDFTLYAVCEKHNVLDYKSKIEEIKNIVFNKYGKRLNKQFEIDISLDNILEFYDPKKVIDTVALMLNMSKKEYMNTFYELLNDNIFNKTLLSELII